MTTYGLTIEDLRGIRQARSSKVRQRVPAKYGNPETGATWTGRGRVPLWLIGKNKEDFLIK
ncbi:H-NS family nucleoid-associated regulatory protein [Pseudoduganella sp. S-14]|uniref:H-NS histone family protein n=1 Tax=Pseudoduganella sp. S-14 TaxID=3404065 RepID=UPI003CE8117B